MHRHQGILNKIVKVMQFFVDQNKKYNYTVIFFK